MKRLMMMIVLSEGVVVVMPQKMTFGLAAYTRARFNGHNTHTGGGKHGRTG